MHGLINRGIQCFVVGIYGNDIWEDVCAEAGLNYSNFETMLYYDDIITEQLLDAVCHATNRTRPEILEDFGTFIVSEHCSLSARKLLRLGSESFVEFLHSLEEISERIQVAIPDFETPMMRLEVKSDKEYVLRYEFYKSGYGAVFLGLLLAMAADYDTLVTIDHQTRLQGTIDKDIFSIQVFTDQWAQTSAQAA